MRSNGVLGSSDRHNLPLDSLRGLAALAVVLHHVTGADSFRATFRHMGLFDVALFHHAYLFVDFFFVLSGVVIAMNYVHRAPDRFSSVDFAIKRFARVYPLHLFMLFAFLGFRIVRLSLSALGILPESSAANGNDLYSFVMNVLLLHGLGFTQELSWNGPSWSISAEFYTYLLFALVLVACATRRSRAGVYMVSALISLASLAAILFVLGRPNMDFNYEFGILRCTYGFFLGVLTYAATNRLAGHLTLPRIARELWLWGALVGGVAIVSLIEFAPDLAGFAAPIFAILFAGLLLFPRGSLPGLLSVGSLVWLGRRSYSIYMTHVLVIMTSEYVLKVIGMGRLAALDARVPGVPATALALAIIAVTLVISDWTYRNVELGGGNWTRRMLARRNATATAR
ncbi:MAG: acyltransferase [Sphingomonas paucimobilis]